MRKHWRPSSSITREITIRYTWASGKNARLVEWMYNKNPKLTRLNVDGSSIEGICSKLRAAMEEHCVKHAPINVDQNNEA